MHQLGVMHYLGEAATDDDQATNEAVRWFRMRRRSTVCILAAPWSTVCLQAAPWSTVCILAAPWSTVCILVAPWPQQSAVSSPQSTVSSRLSARVSYLLRTGCLNYVRTYLCTYRHGGGAWDIGLNVFTRRVFARGDGHTEGRGGRLRLVSW